MCTHIRVSVVALNSCWPNASSLGFSPTCPGNPGPSASLQPHQSGHWGLCLGNGPCVGVHPSQGCHGGGGAISLSGE